MSEQEGLFEVESLTSIDESESSALKTNMHPILGSIVGTRTIETEPISMDDPEHLKKLEKIHRAVEYVQTWYSPPELSSLEKALGPLNSKRHAVDRINNQFTTKVIPSLMNPNQQQALTEFRSIIPNTVDEEMILLTNDEQFAELHAGLNDHLSLIDDELIEDVNTNYIEIKRADRMQFSGRATRSLEKMRESGMTITIDPENIDLIREAYQLSGAGILPLTEYVKNSKVLGVSGFMGSKVSLAVHDYMDHLWTFDMLDRTGILDKYSFMFDSIGNPESTDLYKREGEIVASIAFGVRYFQTMPSAFGPLVRSSQIETHMDTLLVDGKLDSHHMDAYRTLKKMRKGSIDWQSLGFSFSNYITELDQQRRKYGKIKQKDPRTKKLIGELDPMSPDFVSFFIDTHQEIMSPRHKHRNDLFRFHILLEEYLTSFAEEKIGYDQPLTIKPSELRNIDYTKTTLPPQRILWMRNNHGFTATRDAII